MEMNKTTWSVVLSFVIGICRVILVIKWVDGVSCLSCLLLQAWIYGPCHVGHWLLIEEDMDAAIFLHKILF